MAYVPLVIVAAGLAQQLWRRGVAAALTLAVVTFGCLWIARSGYRDLRGTKQLYGRVVDFVRERTRESPVVITDLWWLDQIAAAAIDSRQTFYVPEAETGTSLVRRFSDATVPTITVIRSDGESADTSSWRAGSCYFEERRVRVDVRQLVAIQLRHRCGYAP
jgi:hypothetical protein